MIVLRAALEATQRHAEAIIDRHYACNSGEVCSVCCAVCPCSVAAGAIRSMMLEQLAALDNCERRLQEHDPENGGDVLYRLIRDEARSEVVIGACDCGHEWQTHNIGGGCASGLCDCTRSRP